MQFYHPGEKCGNFCLVCKKYNSVAGHNFPELFSDQDIHLSEQLSISNQEIQDIKDISFTVSPCFSLKLLRNQMFTLDDKGCIITTLICTGTEFILKHYWLNCGL